MDGEMNFSSDTLLKSTNSPSQFTNNVNEQTTKKEAVLKK